MRVLLINPELPPSFWTLKETCRNLGSKALLPPLGLITVAALLPREWQLRLVDLNTSSPAEIAWDWADLVMITGMFVQRAGVLSLIREAKQRGKTVVVGGHYLTSVPHESQEAGADFLVQGEGENTIPLLLAALREGQTQGLFRQEERPDMAASPIPRFDLLKLENYAVLNIQTSRGCPYDCEFCDVVNLFGRKPRYKKPEQILAELEAIYQLGWRQDIFISDDNFIGNKSKARAILNRLIPWMKAHDEPFSFWTQASVNLGQDLAMIDLLTEANFSTVFVGVESPEEELLTRTGKYQNLGNPLEQSLAAIGANGLSMVASFIIGFDQEEKGAGERICDFVEQNSLPLVMVNTLEVLPNTRLWDRLQREGRLLDDQAMGHFQGGKLNYLPTRPAAEIISEHAAALVRLYEPRGFLRRAYRHILAMRPTRRALARQRGENPQVAAIPTGPAKSLRVQGLAGLWSLTWRFGIQTDCRRQFWSQLLGIWRRNPSRLKKYLITCGFGENLFEIREDILRQFRKVKALSK